MRQSRSTVVAAGALTVRRTCRCDRKTTCPAGFPGGLSSLVSVPSQLFSIWNESHWRGPGRLEGNAQHGREASAGVAPAAGDAAHAPPAFAWDPRRLTGCNPIPPGETDTRPPLGDDSLFHLLMANMAGLTAAVGDQGSTLGGRAAQHRWGWDPWSQLRPCFLRGILHL